MKRIEEKIKEIKENSKEKNPVEYFTKGGCYIFAKQLQEEFKGDIYYLLEYAHFVLNINGKFYDATGNVTNLYKSSRMIPEAEIMARKKIMKGIKQLKKAS